MAGLDGRVLVRRIGQLQSGECQQSDPADPFEPPFHRTHDSKFGDISNRTGYSRCKDCAKFPLMAELH